MTYFLIAVNFAVWIFVQGAGLRRPDSSRRPSATWGWCLASSPIWRPWDSPFRSGRGWSCAVDNDPINILTPLISMFLHGGWMHMIGNMIYLAVFGRNVEDSMGRGRFLAFYLHLRADRGGDPHRVQRGVTGADRRRVRGDFRRPGGVPRPVPQRAGPDVCVHLRCPCSGVAGAHLLVRVAGSDGRLALNQLNRTSPAGTAVWAHVGGFLAGVALARLFVNQELLGARMSGSGSGYPDSYA